MVVYEAMNAWVREQDAAWRALAGSTIVQWVGTDESVGDDDTILFLDRTSPFRQLDRLRIMPESGRVLDLGSYQNDSVFGMSIELSDGEPLHESQWQRRSDLSDLPTGKVQNLELHLDARDGNSADVIEVELTIDDQKILIVKAEVHDWDSRIFVWADESLFLFADPKAARQVRWNNKRQYIAATPK